MVFVRGPAYAEEEKPFKEHKYMNMNLYDINIA